MYLLALEDYSFYSQAIDKLKQIVFSTQNIPLGFFMRCIAALTKGVAIPKR
jgi:hypothetical protein